MVGVSANRRHRGQARRRRIDPDLGAQAPPARLLASHLGEQVIGPASHQVTART
ncbi:MAG: hypothetical protein R2939_12960 [Kofleriaceae bacterium]